MSENLPLHAPFAGTVIAIAREPDDHVSAGQVLVVIEAMKMEHEIPANVTGVVRSLEVAVGDSVDEGQLLAVLAPGGVSDRPEQPHDATAPGTSDDLAAVKARHDQTLDAAQLGGALVIRPDGSVAWSHMSADAGDNASPEEILAAVREAVA